jgi:hypothetical protein
MDGWMDASRMDPGWIQDGSMDEGEMASLLGSFSCQHYP